MTPELWLLAAVDLIGIVGGIAAGWFLAGWWEERKRRSK